MKTLDCRRTCILLLAFFLLLCKAGVLWSALAYNRVLVDVLKDLRQYQPENNPLWAVGIYARSHTDVTQPRHLNYGEAPNANWDYSWLAPWAISAADRLVRTVPNSQASIRVIRSLARMELFAGKPALALEHLQTAANAMSCSNPAVQDISCTLLWTDMGDALDALGRYREALDYYQKAGWFRRHEAGAEIALRLLHEGGSTLDSAEVDQLLTIIEDLLPNSLLARYEQYLCNGSASGIDRLRYFGDPRLTLAIRRDPRLERRTAEVMASLLQQGIWDEETLARVLTFRAWQVDLHSFRYRNFRIVKVWTPSQDPDPMQLAALEAFFNHLSTRLPDNPFVWWAKGEFYERLGDCATSAFAYARASQVGVDEYWIRQEPPKNSPCSKRTGESTELSNQEGILFSTDFDLWWSYGQALDITSVPSNEAGYDDAPQGWVWGPDTLHPLNSHASFRADCVWQEQDLGKRPAPLFSTLVERGTGHARLFVIPAGHTLVVDYWWFARGNINMAYRGQEPFVERDLGDKDGWHHSQWVFTPVPHERTITLSWSLNGCGSFWLGRLEVRRGSDSS